MKCFNFIQGESLSELELMKVKQKQDRLQLLESIQQEKDRYQQYQPIYQEHHIIKKQYSETSIPSTNADPLNSNSPTPPMMNHKYYAKNNNTDRSSQKNYNYIDKGNLQGPTNKKYYYKLNDGSTEKINGKIFYQHFSKLNQIKRFASIKFQVQKNHSRQ